MIGYKNAGKTTLVERLVAEFTARGLRVSTVKHAHHSFDLDAPGKDTYRHRAAGAGQVMMATSTRWVLMTELRGAAEPELADLLAQMAKVDLVVVEGYKRDTHPKIEVWREATGHPIIAPGDPTVRAVTTDTVAEVDRPLLDLNDIAAIADFIWADLHPKGPFDRFIMVDWGAGNDTGPRPRKDAIWCAENADDPVYLRNRQQAEAHIVSRIEAALAVGERLCLGFDFGFAFPAGFGTALIRTEDPFAMWDWLEARIEDSPKANNRFDLAGEINARFPGIGPFWGNGLTQDIAHLPRKGTKRTQVWPNPKRQVEMRAPGAFECWQLSGAGAVGSQILMGLPVLARLRRRFGDRLAVWPFEAWEAPVMLVEIWPSLIAKQVQAAAHLHSIKDAVQVSLLAQALRRLGPDIRALMDVPRGTEGWILGVGQEDRLAQAAEEVIAGGAA